MDKGIIKKRLLEAGYSDNRALDATVNRLSVLKGKPLELLESWINDGQEPSFDAIEGIDCKFLKEKLSMKAPAIIIAYTMLLDNAKENADYFKHLANNIVGFYPNI